ncbi:MAG: GNAT family N-acetyltransferase [Hyphomicrobiales bacterium]
MPETAIQQAAPMFQIIDDKAALSPQFVAAWRALSERAYVPNPFWDPHFCIPAMTLATPGTIKIATLTNPDGSLAALAPFTLKRVMKVGPKVAVLWTHDYIPLGTPLIAAADETAFQSLLLGIMNETGSPLLAYALKQLPKLGTLSKDIIATHVINTHHRAALQSSEPGETYRRATLSKQRRQGLDRRFRRLGERTAHLGKLEIDLCRDPEIIPSRFEAFMRLEQVGWKGGNNTALLSNKLHADFARDAALKLAQRQSAMVATLKAGETVLAALTLFQINGETFSWKTAFDNNYKECSPGTQLLARFADPVMGCGEPFRLDSCAAANNEIANAIWGERVCVQNIIFSTPSQSTQANAIKHAEQLKQQTKQKLKSILNR